MYNKNNKSLTQRVRKTLVQVLIQREKIKVLNSLQEGQVLQSWEYVKNFFRVNYKKF